MYSLLAELTELQRLTVVMVLSIPVAFAVYTLLLERYWAARPGQRFLRAGLRTDIAWMGAGPVFRLLAGLLVAAGSFLIARMIMLCMGQPMSLLPITFFPNSVLAHQPMWLRGAEIYLLSEVFDYWIHRALHHPLLWRFHAIHHSSVELDWTASVRIHPIDLAISLIPSVLAPAIAVALGMVSPAPAAGFSLLTAVQSRVRNFSAHSNLRWTYGPLNWVIGSPLYHRWHHSAEPDAIDKNFSVRLPLLDLVFGTYFMPKGRIPLALGTPHDPIPESFFGQLTFPFRRLTPKRTESTGSSVSLNVESEQERARRLQSST